MYVGDVAAREPSRVAIQMPGTAVRLDYADVDRRSSAIARHLRNRGVTSGQTVALLAGNGPFFIEAAVAAHRIGIRYTTINTHLRQDDIEYILRDAGASALLVGAGFAGLVDALDSASRPRVVITEEAAGTSSGDSVPMSRVLASDPGGPLADEIAGSPMVYSSGTTGRPKGVAFPLTGGHPRIIDDFTSHFVDLFGIDQDTVMLLPGPLYHTSPLFYANMVLRKGGKLVILEKFDAEAALAAIHDFGVTHSFFVPTMLIRMLRLPPEIKQRYDLSTHRFSLHGAGPCPAEVKLGIREWWGPIVWEGYAGSERNGMTILAPEDVVGHPNSVGRPVGCEVVVVGDDGQELPRGETGVVYFSGGARFAYHNDPEKTQQAYLDEKTSTIGDIGFLDDDGFLHLTDRLANVVISGGVNIYPQEIEQLLSVHPEVQDVAAMGVADDELGEVLVAVVQPTSVARAGPALARELLSYCTENAARYKCPRRIIFSDQLPRQPNGKLLKRLITIPDDDQRTSEAETTR